MAGKTYSEPRSIFLSPGAKFSGAFLNKEGTAVHLEFIDGDNYGHAAAVDADGAFDLAVKLISFARRLQKAAQKAKARG